MNYKSFVKTVFALIFLFGLLDSFAQTKRWMLLDKNETREVFIDTSSIKISDDQLSVWVLDIFEEPEEINDDGLKAKRARTQYLFNIANNTFSVIGNLYYDEVGKIISQQYNPRIGGIGRSFYQNIDGNPIVNNLYSNLTDYLEISVQRPKLNLTTSNRTDGTNIVPELSDNVNKSENNEIAFRKDIADEEEDINDSDLPQKDLAVVPKMNPIEFKKKEAIVGRPNQDENESDNASSITKFTNPNLNSRIAQIYDPVSGDYIELRSKTPIISAEESVDLTDYQYNFDNETNITNTIFSDGKTYCFQVSSWKRKSIADNELRKLKQKGHNAFIVSAKPKHKSGIWYRVRIGYFNSRAEAEAYRNSM